MPLPWTSARPRQLAGGARVRRSSAVDREFATHLLGGTEELAAKWLRVDVETYRDWPEVLNEYMVDRVIAATYRAAAAKATRQSPSQYFRDPRNKAFIEQMLQRVALTAVLTNLLPQVPAQFARMGPVSDDDPAAPPRRRKRPTTPTTTSPPIAAAAAG